MEHPYKTPEADLAEEKLTARGFLSGGQPLWKAFWLFFAAGFLLLSVAARQAMVAIVDPLMQEGGPDLVGNDRCRAGETGLPMPQPRRGLALRAQFPLGGCAPCQQGGAVGTDTPDPLLDLSGLGLARQSLSDAPRLASMLVRPTPLACVG